MKLDESGRFDALVKAMTGPHAQSPSSPVKPQTWKLPTIVTKPNLTKVFRQMLTANVNVTAID